VRPPAKPHSQHCVAHPNLQRVLRTHCQLSGSLSRQACASLIGFQGTGHLGTRPNAGWPFLMERSGRRRLSVWTIDTRQLVEPAVPVQSGQWPLPSVTKARARSRDRAPFIATVPRSLSLQKGRPAIPIPPRSCLDAPHRHVQIGRLRRVAETSIQQHPHRGDPRRGRCGHVIPNRGERGDGRRPFQACSLNDRGAAAVRRRCCLGASVTVAGFRSQHR